ncbi:MAG: hypothetical protein E7040_03540 [Lentisphaerae bacterium]|nr:hypothetical protein [Lentisphaerota bacterium]
MAEHIDKTAQQIDKGTGSKLAAEMKAKDFTHRDLDNMEKNLRKLPVGVDPLIKQRNELVDIICNLTQAANNISGANAIVVANKDALTDPKLCTDEGNRLILKVDQYMQKEKGEYLTIRKNFATAGNSLGLSSSEAKIREDKGENLLAEINTAVKKEKDLRIKAENALRQLARVSSGDAEKIGEQIAKERAKLQNELSGERRMKENALRDAKNLRNQKASLERSNQKLRNDVTKLSAEVALLKKRINPTNNANVHRMEYGVKDARYYMNLYSMVRGEVKKIDPKWNFVIIDLGSKYEIRQTYAGRTYKTLLDITPGKVLTVVRGIGTKKPEVVAEIVLAEVYADHSVADIKVQHSPIKEGDVVIFDKKHNDQLNVNVQKLLDPKR